MGKKENVQNFDGEPVVNALGWLVMCFQTTKIGGI
jgi:hypothetical protein